MGSIRCSVSRILDATIPGADTITSLDLLNKVCNFVVPATVVVFVSITVSSVLTMAAY